ncbi:MAG: class I SAM-dependent methyltransferase family protein [Aigarchaeota archaeon]|nr:class I SAM-dependent methyltransferase family protein [Candidatus Pelearchaeum maunauluense]
MPSVKAPKVLAEQLIKELEKSGILDRGRVIRREGEHVFIPVVSTAGLKLPEECHVVHVENPPAERRSRSVVDALRDKVDAELLKRIPRSFDIIGDVAVINELDAEQRVLEAIGQAIMEVHKNVRLVLAKSSPLAGEERVGGYRVVAGVGGAETTHRESGCVYKLDITRVFFSPRLSGERLRVATQVRSDEQVVDMFAGVGPFSILIAKKTPSCRVVAVEKNESAYRYLCENIRLNKVGDRVTPLLGDVRNHVSALRGLADRVIMNLPHQSQDFLGDALQILKKEGLIHFYTIAQRDDQSDAERRVSSVLSALDVDYGFLFSRAVKEVSPSKVMMVFDIRVVKG